MQELNDVELQQSALLSELGAIEDELDAILPQQMGQQMQLAGDKDNRFLKQVMRNPDLYEQAPSREQVFQKALDLERDIRDLDQDLSVVSDQMRQSERQHARAAEIYLSNGNSNQAEQVTDMEKTLENFYASLKWIENATVDLKFQVDDIQGKVDT